MSGVWSRMWPAQGRAKRGAYVLGAMLLSGLVLIPAGIGAGASASSPIASCAYGTGVPGLSAFLPGAVERAAQNYAGGLTNADSTTRAKAQQVFAAAAAAYVYGLPQLSVRVNARHFARNELVSIAALTNPQVTTVVAPNVDTAYTVAWLDLTTGPIVINVPDTGGRFYTFQFLDAFSNAFAYVGTGSTGTKAGAYALVPPGWTGSLPAGVTRIDAPSNTVWLLGRTLVKDAADLPAVKSLQEQYTATPLAAWEDGTRTPPVVLDQYPPTIPKSIPSGAEFIATLNNEMNIDPPPTADHCALQAMSAAGVQIPHPTPAQSLVDDLSDEAPPLPPVASDPVANAALSAGTAAATKIIATGESTLNASSRSANYGWEILGSWVGRYGTRYLGRAIVATDLLAANTPQQTIYPIADTDVTGRALNGSSSYTIRFPKGDLPPVNAFWSLTMYNASFFLYANQIDRYAIGDRTAALHIAPDGSLTIYVQHAEPTNPAQRANWLPAPAAPFHLILRLYQPKPTAFNGVWKPAPVQRVGAVLKPVLSALRIGHASFRPARSGRVTAARGPARVSYRDSQPVSTAFAIVAIKSRRGCRPARAKRCLRYVTVARFSHGDRAGSNSFFLTGRVKGHALARGRYQLRAVAGGSGGWPTGIARTLAFRIAR